MAGKLTGWLGGLGLALTLSACSPPAEQPAQQPDPQHTDTDHADEADHVHPTAGPHGGHLIELGNEQYHAELLHDGDTHTVTVHLLDSAGRQPVAADQPQITLQVFQDGQFVDYTLKAAGDKAAGTSEFQVVDERLTQLLSQGEQARGRLRVSIDGQPLVGTLDHAGH